MEGYVNTTSQSRYIETLLALDKVFQINTSPDASSITTEYYRFGDTTQKINRDLYRDAQVPGFYNGSDPRFTLLPVSDVSTVISKQPDKNEELIAVVTDLYQKEEDITQVSKPIKEYYLNNEGVKKGYAVGVIAIKSEFNGKIYAEDRANKEMKYSTEGKSNDKFHPFYIILIGSSNHIKHYTQQIRESIDKGNQSSNFIKSTIFSPSQIIEKPSRVQAQESQKLPEGILRPTSLNNGKIAIETKVDEPAELLEINDKEAKNSEITYIVPFQAFANTLTVKADKILIKPTVQEFNVSGELESSSNDSVKKLLTLGDWKLTSESNQQLQFKAVLYPKATDTQGIYIFNFEAMATELQDEKDPSQTWWSEWSSTSKTIEDGSKTYNLLEFLRQLRSMTSDSLPVGDKNRLVGKFCYAVQTR